MELEWIIIVLLFVDKSQINCIVVVRSYIVNSICWDRISIRIVKITSGDKMIAFI
jgi:hypothetical protein